MRLRERIYQLQVWGNTAAEIAKLEGHGRPSTVTKDVNRFWERVAVAQELFKHGDPPAYCSINEAARAVNTTPNVVLDLLTRGKLAGTLLKTSSGSDWQLSLMQVISLANKLKSSAHIVNTITPLECDMSPLYL